MAERIVVDASAVAKLFLTEPESEAFKGWYDEAFDAGDQILAPTLIQYELGHVVSREIKGKEVQRQVWKDSLNGIRLVSTTIEASFRYVPLVTFFDAAYLHVAVLESAPLVTYDERLRRAARRHRVAALSPGRSRRGRPV